MLEARMMTVGGVEVLGLCDAVIDHPMPLSQIFPGPPAAEWEPHRRRHPAAYGGPDTWRWSFGCYLVRSQGRTILVDTGVGPADAPLAASLGTSGRLPEQLVAAGAAPEAIDTVLLTHLHPDHVGWNLLWEDDTAHLAFPRAHYLVHRADWETFQRPEAQPFPYVDRTVTPLEFLGAVQLLTGEHRLTDEVTAIHTPGHTPGHMSVLLTSGDERALLLSDAVFDPAQVTEPDWNSAFEFDGEAARQTRRELLDRAEAEEMTVSASHFPGPAFGRLVREDGRRYWQPLLPM